MPGKYTRDLTTAPSIDCDSLVCTSEETTDELYKATVSNLATAMDTCNVSACSVNRLSALTIPTGTSKLVFDNAQYDIGADYNTSSGVFTCPTNGYYLIHVQLSIKNDSGSSWGANQRVDLYNGTEIAHRDDWGVSLFFVETTWPNTRTRTFNITYLYEGSTSDTLSAWVYITSGMSGAKVVLSGMSFVSIAKIKGIG